jgi:hypothetical protein
MGFYCLDHILGNSKYFQKTRNDSSFLVVKIENVSYNILLAKPPIQ